MCKHGQGFGMDNCCGQVLDGGTQEERLIAYINFSPPTMKSVSRWSITLKLYRSSPAKRPDHGYAVGTVALSKSQTASSET